MRTCAFVIDLSIRRSTVVYMVIDVHPAVLCITHHPAVSGRSICSCGISFSGRYPRWRQHACRFAQQNKRLFVLQVAFLEISVLAGLLYADEELLLWRYLRHRVKLVFQHICTLPGIHAKRKGSELPLDRHIHCPADVGIIGLSCVNLHLGA